MRTSPDLSTLTIVRRLARRVKRLEREAESNGRGQQAAHRSVHDGAFTVYDENDVERLRLGRQDDGSYGVKHKGGDPPSVPTPPLVTSILGGAMIQWDGFQADGEAYDPGEVAYLRVHLLATADDVPDDDNLAGTIVSYAGGALTIAQDAAVSTWATLVAVNAAGIESDPSGTELVLACAFEDDDAYVLTTEDVAAGTANIPLSYVPLDESLKVWVGGIFQPPTEYTVDYTTGTVTWPLDAIRDKAGMQFAFHYVYRPRGSLPVFTGADTASANSASITVPIPAARQAGDLLLVAVARLLPSVPAGWTKIKDVPYGIGGLTVLARVSDGTEATVTLTSGSSGDQGAICLVYAGGAVLSSATNLTQNVASATNYQAPSANGRTRVSFFLFDGVGTSGSLEETIATVTGTQRANRTISSGLFSIAAVEGSRAVVTDASPDAGTHDWASVTVGLT